MKHFSIIKNLTTDHFIATALMTTLLVLMAWTVPAHAFNAGQGGLTGRIG